MAYRNKYIFLAGSFFLTPWNLEEVLGHGCISTGRLMGWAGISTVGILAAFHQGWVFLHLTF